MSYQSRQKKRRHKRIEAKARQRRSPGSPGSAQRWFLTIAKRPGRFECCDRPFARGDAIVYRHEPRSIRCQGCAARDPESAGFRASIRYDNARRAAA